MADVKPLKAAAKADLKAVRKRAPGLAQRRAAAVAAPEAAGCPWPDTPAPPVGSHDIIGHVQPGVQHGVYGKLRRGHYRPEAALDLHRMSVAEARLEVWHFLRHVRANQMRTVIILHGKGDRSARGAVLKSYLAFWLVRAPEVLAYHSAQPRHGGAGALYVLLKKSELAREHNRERYSKKGYE